jgi:septal ring factor EnvC (AmiA/AmiB activator)
MKTWLVIVSVVAVLLAASTGVGFWMLSDTKAELTSTKTELADTEAELASTEAELTSTEAENADLNETLMEAKARWELIEGIFIPALTGELDEMTEAELVARFLEWRDQIMAIGDPTLEALFQEFIDSDISDEAAFNFFVYLFESMAEALE